MVERGRDLDHLRRGASANTIFEHFLSLHKFTLADQMFTELKGKHGISELDIIHLANTLDPPLRQSLIRFIGSDRFNEQKFRMHVNLKARRLFQQKPEHYQELSELFWHYYIQPGWLEPRTFLWGRSALVQFIPFLARFLDESTWIITDGDRLKRANDVDQQVGHIIIQTFFMGVQHFCKQRYASFCFAPNLVGSDEGIAMIPEPIDFNPLTLTNEINDFIAAEVPSIASLVGRETIFGEPLMIRHNREVLTPTSQQMNQWQQRAEQLGDEEVLNQPPTVTAASTIIHLSKLNDPGKQCFTEFSTVMHQVELLKQYRHIRRVLR